MFDFSVYKITNIINQKKYIGSSIRVYKRWQQEKNAAFNPNNSSYNYPLSIAFRKYGLQNFKFEIIKSDFLNFEEMWEYEYQMILNYNSLTPNGYNQTLYTKCSLRDPNFKKVGQKCALTDYNETILEVYPSYQEAARQNEIENAANRIRLVCLGKASSVQGKIFRCLDDNNKVIHQPLKPYCNKKRIIGIDPTIKQQNVIFDSILNAAKTLNIDRTSIQKCIMGESRYSIVGGYIFRLLDDNNDIIPNCINLNDKIEEYNRIHPIINNEQHTITEWCQIYNISRNCFYKRIKKGMTEIEAITIPKRK